MTKTKDTSREGRPELKVTLIEIEKNEKQAFREGVVKERKTMKAKVSEWIRREYGHLIGDGRGDS